jgi:hypothetical protein
MRAFLLCVLACTPVGFTPPLDGDQPPSHSAPTASSTEPDAGLPVPPPPQPPRKVWKDSTGAVVAYDDLTFIDGNGYAWTINAVMAQVVEVADQSRDYRLYASTDCSGAVYVPATMPARWPFQLRSESGWHVRPDTLRAASLLVQSGGAGPGNCVLLPDGPTTRSVIPLASAVPVTPPQLPWSPPLHLELVP